MASPNINMRDPVIYRIRHARITAPATSGASTRCTTTRTAYRMRWSAITHSICTLEFQDHRPLYDWVIEKLAEGGRAAAAAAAAVRVRAAQPHVRRAVEAQAAQLVEDGHVDGWDDPRMPTLVGARRRGFTPEGFRLFAERIGVSKSDSWIDMSVLEDTMRDELNARDACGAWQCSTRYRLVIDNYPDGESEECFAPNHPQQPDLGRRAIPLSRELWIEREDFTETPPKGYFRLTPGAEVRLRYGYIIRCIGVDKDADGNVTTVHCTYDPATRSGTPGADARKVKGNIHWLSVAHAVPAEVRLYDRLFAVPFPGARISGDERGGRRRGAGTHACRRAGRRGRRCRRGPAERNFLDDLNPDVEAHHHGVRRACARQRRAEDRFQFERHGYFVADLVDHDPERLVFNRTVTLRDSWSKKPG